MCISYVIRPCGYDVNCYDDDDDDDKEISYITLFTQRKGAYITDDASWKNLAKIFQVHRL